MIYIGFNGNPIAAPKRSPIANLLNQFTMSTTYKGYEVHRNRLDKKFYAYPVNDFTTCRRIVCDTAIELRAAIDKATENQSLNPWELPRATA